MLVLVIQAKHIRGGSVLDPTSAKNVNPAQAVKLRYLQELAGKGVTVDGSRLRTAGLGKYAPLTTLST